MARGLHIHVPCCWVSGGFALPGHPDGEEATAGNAGTGPASGRACLSDGNECSKQPLVNHYDVE